VQAAEAEIRDNGNSSMKETNMLLWISILIGCNDGKSPFAEDPQTSVCEALCDVGTTCAAEERNISCLLYTSDAADDMQCVDLGGRRLHKKKTRKHNDQTEILSISKEQYKLNS